MSFEGGIVNRSLLRVLVSLLLVFGLVACGAGAEPEPTATPEPEPTDIPASPTPEPTETTEPTATPEPSPTPSNAVMELTDVENAVIQIVAQGTFIDPAEGLLQNAAGAGSGFIISEDGLAVTNNHVVTGAAILQVYVGGEDDPRNARVLGVSECSDLALIDLEGGDYPYLEWFDGEIDVGLDVYAAGFPLGDPEFTLTRGIISKERAGGETEWASVDYVLEHDATINPGNSGGPLVDENGRVVGVNYAGASSVNQYFAISSDEAIPLLDELREGDVNSIGINGSAVYDGIWVASVKSGSPADRTRLQPGDIITRMEGLDLALDGTMADYCDILRSRDADDTLSIEVLRNETEEYLEGQINGRELELSFSFAQTLEEDVPDENGETSGSDADVYEEYTVISDESGQLSMEVPVEWSDVNGAQWTVDEQPVGTALSAAPSLDDFYGTWTTPGVFFGASRTLLDSYDEAGLLDDTSFEGTCEYDGRYDYQDALYTGLYDLWLNCDGTGTSFLVLTVVPEDRSFLALVQVQVVSDKDLDALDRILSSFIVSGSLE
jgi:serine protease Do